MARVSGNIDWWLCRPWFRQAAVAIFEPVANTAPQPSVLAVGNVVANQAMDEGIEQQSTVFAGLSLLVLFLLFVWLRMTAAGGLMVLLLAASLIELKALQILLHHQTASFCRPHRCC